MQQLDWLQVFIIFCIGLVNAILVGLFSKTQSKVAVIATIRSLIQLLLLGFFLQIIFDNDNWWIKLLTLLLMIFNGSYTLKKRTIFKGGNVFSYFVIMVISTFPGIILAYLLLGEEYFSRPFFLIPYIGMLIGNSLTGLTLGVNGLFEEILRSKKEIISKLSYNYSQKEAIKDVFKLSIKNGLTPILNTMLIVGIVSIPGLMTGQMMAGASPFLSARYQYFLIIAIETTIIFGLLLYYFYLNLKMKSNEFFLMEIIDESH